ncbi:MAG: cysteine desulfurase family protein [Lacipirellulaceae bacterium]
MALELPVYLDNHATTRVDPRVVEAMLPYFTEDYGNANSEIHSFGGAAEQAVESSRAVIAESIGATPEEIVFTSGATESNNLAIRGIAEHRRQRAKQIISVKTEHAAVLEPLTRLGRIGFQIELLDVAAHGKANAGQVDMEQLFDALKQETALVSVMLANNEIGVIQPLEEIASHCHEREVPFHCDATQAVGKLPVDVNTLGVDLMSFTAHKLHGPKGVGALYVRRKRPALRLSPQISGGGQQSGIRSGTLNVAGIVGFAKAVQLSLSGMAQESKRLGQLRSRLDNQLREALGPSQVILCGPDCQADDGRGNPLRLPGNLNVAFPGLDGEAIMLETPDLAVSSGAACSSTDGSPSHVLLALGMSEDLARSTVRFGLGRFNTEEEIDFAASQIITAVTRLKQL